MKKLTAITAAVILSATSWASQVTTETFSETLVNIPAKVRIVEGDDFGFMVQATDSIVAKSVRVSLSDGVLQFSFGQPTAPGLTAYDSATDTYYYGINTINQTIRDESFDEELIITVSAPVLPLLRVSSDYEMVDVSSAEKA